MHRVLRSFDWGEGDEFVTTSLEHVSTADASRGLEQERGVTVKVVEVDESDAAFIESLDGAVTEDTKLLLISHVASPNGRVMPVREAVDVAHEKGVPVLVDAAQSVGQFPVDAQALGCDFLIGSGPKWLLGPMGSGYVWVSPDQSDNFRPYFTPDVGAWSKPGAPVATPTARSRAEFGTYNHPLVIGIGEAVKTLMSVGLDTIRDHVAGLSKTLREEMQDTPGVNVLTPMEPGQVGRCHDANVRRLCRGRPAKPRPVAQRRAQHSGQGPMADRAASTGQDRDANLRRGFQHRGRGPTPHRLNSGRHPQVEPLGRLLSPAPQTRV